MALKEKVEIMWTRSMRPRKWGRDKLFWTG